MSVAASRDSLSQAAQPFAGKIAVVTGGSRGIGRAIALRLAEEGATLVLASRTASTLADVAAEITAMGGTASVVPLDLRRAETPAILVDAAIKAHGAIDIVVNNAGAARAGDFLAFTDADWADGFALKFFGAVRLTRAAWPYLRERSGSVLNIIGIGGRAPGAAEFTIAGSVNGAFLSFTKALAELGVRDGVQVNAINPGPVRTDRLRPLLARMAAEHGDDIEEAIAHLLRRSNFRRLGEPVDIANLAVFMLSPQGGWLHGSLIDMDGGQSKSI
jgi:NAD(P)-dependent dehydrogenase (short-subunit alcohol dehydrogenase family)